MPEWMASYSIIRGWFLAPAKVNALRGSNSVFEHHAAEVGVEGLFEILVAASHNL
jgi:hypothetical protein